MWSFGRFLGVYFMFSKNNSYREVSRDTVLPRMVRKTIQGRVLSTIKGGLFSLLCCQPRAFPDSSKTSFTRATPRTQCLPKTWNRRPICIIQTRVRESRPHFSSPIAPEAVLTARRHSSRPGSWSKICIYSIEVRDGGGSSAR